MVSHLLKEQKNRASGSIIDSNPLSGDPSFHHKFHEEAKRVLLS